MKIIDEEMLEGISAEEMERLRREIRILSRRVREELRRRDRYCPYCGEQLGTSDYGFRYCSAWHQYLDSSENETKLSREEFERKRARNRIRTIKKARGAGAKPAETASSEQSAALQASLENLRIRRVLREYQIITGESLSAPKRTDRRTKASDQ
jgi:hypothetical protein